MTLAIHKTVPRADPTRTGKLRQSYRGQFRRRWRRVKGLVNTTFIENDAAELADPEKHRPLHIHASPAETFTFGNVEQLSDEFAVWFRQVVAEEVGGVSPRAATQDPLYTWQKPLVQGAVIKGMDSALNALRRAGVQNLATSAHELIRHPHFARTVRELSIQHYDRLKTVQDATVSQAARKTRDTLVQGYAEHQTPRQMARNLAGAINDRVDKVGLRRSLTIVRTEITRAHAEASLTTYEAAGVQKVTNFAEFSTASDERVCPICLGWEGVAVTIKEARGTIPLHPMCRCIWLPSFDEHQDFLPKGTLDKILMRLDLVL